jgi:hypothetical protein
VQTADPGAVALGQIVRPDRLGAQRAALREVLVDAALGAVDGSGDLLGECRERLGEESRVSVVFVDEGVGVGVVVGDDRLLAGPVVPKYRPRPRKQQGTIV